MKLFDTTLRDGGNVVGHGFNKRLTRSIIGGLIQAGIRDIEYGNCKGLGAYEKLNASMAPTDEEYFAMVSDFVNSGNIGMFMLSNCADKLLVQKAADSGLKFIRIGANASDAEHAQNAIEMVKKESLECRYALMKAYILTPAELAQEAKLLEKIGVDKITIMDSAGTMFPDDVKEYVSVLKETLSIPVGFHGHSNLGLSQANALVAASAGADEIDCGLLGMARSAGNCATELAVATLQKKGYLGDIDLYALLDYLDQELIPLMKEYNYSVAVKPVDLILGLSGCHSSFLSLFSDVASQENVSLYKLISKVSDLDRKSPGEELIRDIAKSLQQQN